ncbi:hypothetical protein [Paenibacillus paeoniae]|uniref:hypothetical protein n=1 Tax=Paenibacillus paeoniae TaxID=2292705 RepID=UPI0019811E5C|nr:hypothetical protein [Paenibacillus paeoniae]
MVYVVLIVFIVASMRAFRYYGISEPYSKGIALAAAFSLLGLGCLAHNHAISLVAEANDGIGISNPIVYMIIGEDRWSVQLFESYFNGAIVLNFLMIVAYPVVLTMEKKRSGKRKKTINDTVLE